MEQTDFDASEEGMAPLQMGMGGAVPESVQLGGATENPAIAAGFDGSTSAGIVNGVPKYNYTTEQHTYYLPDEVKESSEPITVA